MRFLAGGKDSSRRTGFAIALLPEPGPALKVTIKAISEGTENWRAALTQYCPLSIRQQENDMKNDNDANGTTEKRILEPQFVVRSGELLAFLAPDSRSERGQFTFGVFPRGLSPRAQGNRSELMLPEFNECDIADVVRLAHTLAYVVAENPRTATAMRNDLGCLASCLDHVFANPLKAN